MGNSEAKARAWVEFLTSEPRVPFGSTLKAHFDAGTITRLCDCGCNSFDIEIPEGVALLPIARGDEHAKDAMVFEIVYESTAEAEVTFMIFVDARGYLTSLDVMCGAAPLPDDVRLGRVVYAG